VTESYLNVMRTGEPFNVEELPYKDERVTGVYRIRAFRLPGDRLAVSFDDVSERVRARDALRASEERLLLAQRVGGVGLMDLQVDTGREVWTRTTYDLLGLDPAETTPGPEAWVEAIHPDDRAGAVRFMGHLMHGANPGPQEYRIVHPSGEVRWVRGIARVFMDEERKTVERILATIHDISSQKAAEDAIRKSESRWRTLFENMRDGWFSTDLDGSFLECNRAFLSLVDRPREEVEGISYRDLTPPGYHGMEARMETRILDHGFSGIYEKEYLRGDGSRVPVELAVYLLRDDEGQPAGYWGMARDISQRRAAEDALKESEARFRGVFQESPLGIALATPEGAIIEVNATFAGLLEYSPEDLQGRSVVEITHPEDREREEELIIRVRDRRMPGYQMEKRFLRKDGTPVWCRLTTSSIEGEKGEVRYAVGMVQDITAEIRAKEEIRSFARRLRALAARLTQIREEERTTVSRELHDELGQTLTGLRMDLDLALTEIPGDQVGLRDRISRLIEATDRNIAFVQELSNRLRPSILDVMGLGPAIEWMVDEHRSRASIRFHLDLGDSGRSLPGEQGINLYRIAQEALTNVLRHSEAENVWVSLRREDGSILLRVEDDGIGLQSDTMEAMSSLGLLGMKERALGIGAELTLERRDGGGTVVQVVAPG
jgi:PAS domain S-box-containing protein